MAELWTTLFIGRCYQCARQKNKTPTLYPKATRMGFRGSFLLILLVLQLMASGTAGNIVCTKIAVSHVDNVVNVNTPNYPNPYPASSESCWVVNVTSIPHVTDEIYLLKTSIVASSLEDSAGCVNDYVEVRDGGIVSATSLGKWCGTTSPQIPLTSGSLIYIHFKSDSNNVTVDTKGFELSLTVAVKAQDGGLASQYANCDVMVLGSTSLQYTLISPGYPNNYPNSLNKCWVILISSAISGTSEKRIELSVPDSQLENEAECGSDQVTVRDGDSAVSKLIVGWCGSSKPNTIVSCEQKLYISLQTNYINTYRGFIMNLHVVDKGSTSCSSDRTSAAASAIAGVVGAVCSAVVIWLILVGCRAAYDHQNKHTAVRQTPVAPPTPLPPSPTPGPDRGYRYLPLSAMSSRPNSLSPYFTHPPTPAIASGSSGSANSPSYGIFTRQIPSDYPSELSVSPYTVQCDKGYAEPMQPGYMATTTF